MMNSKAAYLRKIHAYDFAILDLGLYLDTHTWDKQALRKRQELQAERKAAVMAYERKFGPYIPNWNKVKGDNWCWVNSPWPWEYQCPEEM